MNQESKRKSKLVGLNDDKLNAIKKLRQVRNGERRLDQAIDVST